jgi:hypothetical protein
MHEANWITTDDPYLRPFDGVIRARQQKAMELKARIEAAEGSLTDSFATAHERFGWHRNAAGDVEVDFFFFSFFFSSFGFSDVLCL